MTSRELSALGRRYMRRLEMFEWMPRAEFRVVRNLAAEDGTLLDGCSSWHPKERLCWISVAPGDREVMETSLIHEILHVLLEGHAPLRDDYDPGYELALNRTACALWKAWQ